MRELSIYISRKIDINNLRGFEKIFDLVESFIAIANVDDEIKDVACTCFLENLVNKYTKDEKTLRRLIPLMGKHSRDYVKAWDEFTGSKTFGLYD